MANIIDVSASGEPDAALLTRTETSGMLGGTYLRSEPLAAYLGDAEIPQYVLRNKKSGLDIEDVAGSDESTTATTNLADVDRLEPASDYQALAAITDVRIVFVVGTPGGDESATIPLADVATVDVDSAILGSKLTITTAAEDRYVFPCRGDLSAVGEYVDVGSQAWTRAYSLFDAARDHLRAAEQHRGESEFDGAIEAIEEADADLRAASERIAEFGGGAAKALDPEAEELRRTIAERRREIHAEHGVDAHERARTHWGKRRYERAHEAYQEARAAVNRAQDLEYTTPVDERLDRIDDELEELADAPLSYASAMVEEAEASDDAQTTAQCWEVAIERYRDVYALDWACDDERFRGDPDEIRAQVLDAVEQLVANRVAGTQDRLDQAEWLRQSDDIDSAREVIAETIATLERTRRLVAELTHEEYPKLDAARREAEADLAALPDE